MSESGKTLAFIIAAVVAVGLSFVTKPQSAIYDVSEQVGKMLTDPFEPEVAKRLTIVKFDEETATLSEFEVAEQDGVWAIPSKGGYPADAFQQMAQATTGVTDREILSIASESAADHEQFGVVDPRSPKLEVGQTGVGVRVTMADEDNDPIADLIIGKEVKGQPEQRYARRQSQDVTYVVRIDPDQFSTNFEDWIEDDLLNINLSDIEQVVINDYSFELLIDGQNVIPDWRRRGKYTLGYDDSESKWTATSLQKFDPEQKDEETGEEGAYIADDLSDSEALDDDVLRDLSNALDDLKIVDVESKPEGLSGTLRVESDFLDKLDRSGSRSLFSRGFAPLQTSPGQLEVLSSEGEVIVTNKDGVEYVLRFGNAESGAEGDAENQSSDPESGEEETGVNRYLFIVARLNESVLEKPELEEVPEEEEASSEEGAKEEEEAADEEGEPSDDEASTETEQEEGPSERELIVLRNKEKMEAYEAKLAASKQRVEELNDRFGDWYYVVADSVFKKLRLSRDKFVATSDDKNEDDSADENASALGAPGAPVPGLPDLGGVGAGN